MVHQAFEHDHQFGIVGDAQAPHASIDDVRNVGGKAADIPERSDSASVITGDLGVSPATATAITGFDLMADSTNIFARSAQVTGKVFASTYAVPTPENLRAAIGAMETAFTDAASRAPKACWVWMPRN